MFIGVDFSLVATGVVVIDSNELIINRTIRPTKRGGDRLHEISVEVVDTLDMYTPDEVAFEAPFAAPSPAVLNVCLQLAELHGAVKAELARRKLRCPWYVAPTTLKKYATGSGKGEKSDVKLAVFKQWGLTFGDNNQCDAYVLARIAGALHGSLPAKMDYQHDCLKSIRKSPTNEHRSTATLAA
jgi:crossover junction endodeoxyribonuclease RuvC